MLRKYKKLPTRLAAVLMSCLILLSSCGGIKIKDIEGCGDLGPVGAHCKYLFSDRSRDINKLDWDREREGQICFSAEGIGEIKKAILKLCELRRCTYEQVRRIHELSKRIDSIYSPIRILPGPPPS